MVIFVTGSVVLRYVACSVYVSTQRCKSEEVIVIVVLQEFCHSNHVSISFHCAQWVDWGMHSLVSKRVGFACENDSNCLDCQGHRTAATLGSSESGQVYAVLEE